MNAMPISTAPAVELRSNQKPQVVGCPFQELDCDHCKTQFERRLMLDHITHRCPYRDVECKYRALGCSVGKRPLKEMKEHKRKSMESHLSLTARGIFTTKRELQSELTQQGERQQEQNYHYDQQLRHQQEQLTDLQNKMQSQVRRLEHLAFGSLLLAVLVLTIIVLYTAAVQIQNQNDEYPTPLTSDSEVKSCTEEEHVASADISSTTDSGGSRMKEVCTWTLNCDEVDSHDRLELPSDNNVSVDKTPSQKLFERESQTNNKVEDETNNSESDSVDLPVEMAGTAWSKVNDLSSMIMSHMDLDNNTSNMCLVDNDPADSELVADFGGAIASYHIEEPNILERDSLKSLLNSKHSLVCRVKDIFVDRGKERCSQVCEVFHNQSIDSNPSTVSEVQDSKTKGEINLDMKDLHVVNDSKREEGLETSTSTGVHFSNSLVSDLSSMITSHMDFDNNTSNMCLVDNDPADSELMADFGGAIASYHIEEPNILERDSLKSLLNSKHSLVCRVKDIFVDRGMERCSQVCEVFQNQSVDSNSSSVSEVQDSKTKGEINSDMKDLVHVVNVSKKEGLGTTASDVKMQRSIKKDIYVSKPSHSNKKRDVYRTAKAAPSPTNQQRARNVQVGKAHTKRNKKATIHTDQKKYIHDNKAKGYQTLMEKLCEFCSVIITLILLCIGNPVCILVLLVLLLNIGEPSRQWNNNVRYGRRRSRRVIVRRF